MEFPGGRSFAFTIVDDTDVATVENVTPVYRLLERLGMRTTKTVWPVGCPEGSPNFSMSETLEDPDYLAFVRDLAARGFEVTWHGATMESSRRERTEAALARFHEVFGRYPRVHVNHAYNRENLYWGRDRLDQPLLRILYGRLNRRPRDHYQGHVEGSPWWWGDHARQHVEYCRNLTFAEPDLLRINPSMPYADPRRPLAKYWFSAADAEDGPAFERLLDRAARDRLEADGGVCIVATHLGKDFVRGGEVLPGVRAVLEDLAGRNGWFPPVGELLDWLRDRRASHDLPAREWRRMQWTWMRDLVVRQVRGVK